MTHLREWWRRAFLAERPSVGLSLFRIAVAVTVGCHMIPSLLQLPDNYLASAFKETNPSFFPLWALRWVAHSPDWLVAAMAGCWLAAWVFFLVGFRMQPSAVVMTLGCYYFYALNSLHIGTLSFDILLVTLSLIWATPYPGDWLSVDGLIRGDPQGYGRARPFFIQRLLQLQITWMFWYTTLSKFTAGGNWLTDTPYYYLMHYPPMGVVRQFPFRDLLAQHPDWCAAIQRGVIATEVVMPVLWWFRRTRLVGLVLGFAFHVLLLITLHVPTIFFFLFPPQMLLFIEPERLVGWIERRRAREAARPRALLLYDGRCGFCQASVRRLAVLDVFAAIELRDFHGVEDLAGLHPDLTPQRCHSRMQLVEPREEARNVWWGGISAKLEERSRIEPGGQLSDGFYAFRRISRQVALLWLLVPWCYLPGAGWLGQRVYDWIAAHRYLFHSNPICDTNQCRMSEGVRK